LAVLSLACHVGLDYLDGPRILRRIRVLTRCCGVQCRSFQPQSALLRVYTHASWR
jgi:hypothetical protein